MSYFSNWFNKSHNVVSTVKKTVAKVEKFIDKLEVKVAHLATDLAYKLAKGNDVYKEHELKTVNSLGDDWAVLCKSSDFADTNQNAYKAVVFINRNTKQILIATAGTVPTDIHDLKDDAYIAAGTFPSKVDQVKSMVNYVSKLLGADIDSYTFNVTGHSLGAVLTDATAFDIMSRGLKLGTSVTFDSPGSKNAIQAAISARVFSKTLDTTIEELAEHCVVYNAKHNIINYNPIISSPHITEPKLVMSTKQVITNDTATVHSGILGYTGYLAGKVGSLVETCSSYLGVTRTLSELESLKGHSLKNFADICERPVIDTLGWEKTMDGALLIKDFKGSDHITSTGNDIVVITETNIDDDTISISSSEYSYDDLARAYNYNTNKVPLLGADEEFPSLEFIS